MVLTANNKGGSSIPPIEAGTHHAVCFGAVDLGTQETMFKTPTGETKSTHQILLMWEIPSITYEFTDKAGVKTIQTKTITKLYTLSLGEKANLRADLVSWRGIPFTEEELEKFDVFKVLGASCLLQIIHVKKGEKTYGNISSIAKPMKGMPELKPTRQLIRYSMEEDGCLIPATVPDWITTKIKLSAEYQAEMNPPQYNQPPPEESEAATELQLDEKGDIPF
jgi:hypothetical protein